MPVDSKLDAFVDAVLKAGLPHDSLVGMLTSQGWPEREVYAALARSYASLTETEIPRRTGTGTASREAFFYLLIFLTLAVWTIHFGTLAFALIENLLPDPLFAGRPQYVRAEVIPSSLAAILIAFPAYLLLSSRVNRELAAQPEKLDSPIRKWLTYLALAAAAGVILGDLITVLAYVLRGEATARFLLKTSVVLILSGSVLLFYVHDLRRTVADATRKHRYRAVAGLSTAAAASIVLLGFGQLGSPNAQREARADRERVRRLYVLSQSIKSFYDLHGTQLPGRLDQVAGGPLTDPLSHASFPYREEGGSKYQLCATFARASEPTDSNPALEPWAHPAGLVCFHGDATVTLPFLSTFPEN